MTDSIITLATIQKRLTGLKLAWMKKTLEVRLSQADGDAVSYTEFLALLLEDEINNRKDNKSKRLYRKAHFPFEKGIEDFDFTFQPSIRKKNIGALNRKLSYYQNKHSFYRSAGNRQNPFISSFGNPCAFIGCNSFVYHPVGYVRYASSKQSRLYFQQKNPILC